SVTKDTCSECQHGYLRKGDVECVSVRIQEPGRATSVPRGTPFLVEQFHRSPQHVEHPLDRSSTSVTKRKRDFLYACFQPVATPARKGPFPVEAKERRK